MPTEIIMPKLSDTMEEGTILRWYKQPGDHVESGEVLAEVETDKADMELEASASGTMVEIRVKEGASAPVGAVIAVLDGAERAAAERAIQPAEAVTPSAGTGRERKPAPAPAGEEEKPHAAPPRPTRTQPPPPPTTSAHAAPVPRPSTQWKPRPPAAAPHGAQPLSKLRQAVAKQTVQSKREAPHFYVTVEIDMTEAAHLRASMAATAAFPERITFTHLMIRALASTLPRHPRVNASWSEPGIVYHDDVNIGVAVAVEDGLVAPVLRGCHHLSLRAIARATNDLVQKAQAGHFGGDALTGATFTLSNMGMLDVEEFSAVIIPPQAAILAVGAIKDRPVVRDGRIGIARTVRVTLSADHRVLNGVEAARFLEDLKSTLEHPLALLLEG